MSFKQRLPIAVFVCICLLSAVVFWKLENNYDLAAKRQLSVEADKIALSFSMGIQRVENELQNIGKECLRQSEMSSTHIPRKHSNSFQGLPSFILISWLDSNLVSKNKFQDPFLKETKVFKELSTHFTSKTTQKNLPNKPSYYHYKTKQDSLDYFSIQVPIMNQGIFRGLIVSVFKLEDLLDNMLHSDDFQHYAWEIWKADNLIYSNKHTTESFASDRMVQLPFYLGNDHWKVQLGPSKIYEKTLTSAVPVFILIGGIGFGLLLGVIIFITLTSLERKRLLEKAKKRLKKTNRELKQSNERLYSFMKEADISISIWDKDFKLLDVNQFGLKVLNLSSKDNLLGKHMLELNPGMLNSDKYDIYRKVLKTGKPQEIVDELIDPRFGVRYFKIKAFKVGSGLGIAALDITELQITNKELSEKNTELEHYVYAASHDLQEPLNTILGFSKYLQDEYDYDSRGEKYIHFIMGACRNMQDLVKNLLTHSRVGKASQPESVDLNELLYDCILDLQGSINQNQATIETVPLPTVKGYKVDLRHLVMNLLSNAIKYRKADADPSIRISLEQQGNNWLFTFKDNGIGMERKNLNKIFTIFQRLHTKRKFKGTGVGLAICKKVIEVHNGEIWADSEPGKGSAFQFTLPQP